MLTAYTQHQLRAVVWYAAIKFCWIVKDQVNYADMGDASKYQEHITLAVLPFENLTPGGEADFFPDPSV